MITSAPNRLIDEKSPYLLQHAHNPVDWYSWGDEAFEKAKKEDKPIFLSIGYSTCHWCHVMEGESFENEELAELMNDTFVSIKVDREERPDIDNMYMWICQHMTGSGGWPLTILMTPDKKPFFAGTYLPRESRGKMLGMIELTKRVKKMWSEDREELINSAESIITELSKGNKVSSSKEGIESKELDSAFNEFNSSFDVKYGGFGYAPKFPTPHNLLFLLRYYKRTKNSKALNIVEKTLDAMYTGGIFDQVGFGFHRYSTDRKWLIPHFEKMLYDQALLVPAYIETYQCTQNSKYETAARKTLKYVTDVMRSNEGGFYSAEDADTEGEEGRFYVWTLSEIEEVLDKDELAAAREIFGLSEKGNFEKDLNIIHFEKSLESMEGSYEKVEKMLKKLEAAREKRVRPFKDDKMLTDWNGLMIYAFSEAGRVLKDNEYIQIARRAADFFIESSRKNGRLMHRYRNGEWRFEANIDDYAFLVHGLIELYEATFEEKYLESAIKFNNDAVGSFWDDSEGGFFFTAKENADVPINTKEIYDGAVPSGNSVEMLNLLMLSRITGDTKLEEYADKLQKRFAKDVKYSPSSYTQMLIAMDFFLNTSYEVVIAGDRNSKDTMNMIDELNKRFIPNKVVLLNPSDESDTAISRIAGYITNNKSINGRAAAYVCKNFACNKPALNVEEMLKNFE